jgi:hypothetical protein
MTAQEYETIGGAVSRRLAFAPAERAAYLDQVSEQAPGLSVFLRTLEKC